MASYVTCVFLSLTFAGGGSGFVGRHLQKCLRKKGYNVKIISRHPQKDGLTWVSLPESATLSYDEVLWTVDRCLANLHRWRLATLAVCECGQQQIVDTCLLT